MFVVGIGAADDRAVGLGLVIWREAHRLFLPRRPAGRQNSLEGLENFLDGITMLGAFGHLRHHVTVDQLDFLGFVQRSRCDDPVELIDGDAARRERSQGWRRRDQRLCRCGCGHGQAPFT